MTEILYDSPSLNENKTKLKTNPQTKIYRQKIKKNNNKTINTQGRGIIQYFIILLIKRCHI
jgi:hypothetical protein